jgi:hypothetical protein
VISGWRLSTIGRSDSRIRSRPSIGAGFRVRPRVVEQASDAIELSVALLLQLVVRAIGRLPPSAAPLDRRRRGAELEGHADRRRHGALFPREAVEIHHRSLTAEQAAAGCGDDGRQPVGAGDGDGLAVVVERHLRAELRVEVEDFVGVAESARSRILQPHRRLRVDEAGITSAPAASMVCAPEGTLTFAPTASMTPSRMTMVPRSIAGLAIGKIFALVIATTPRVAVRGRGAAVVWRRDGS